MDLGLRGSTSKTATCKGRGGEWREVYALGARNHRVATVCPCLIEDNNVQDLMQNYLPYKHNLFDFWGSSVLGALPMSWVYGKFAPAHVHPEVIESTVEASNAHDILQQLTLTITQP